VFEQAVERLANQIDEEALKGVIGMIEDEQKKEEKMKLEPTMKASLRKVNYHLGSVFTFGKHKGHTVHRVINEDPEYIKWCLSNVDEFSLSKKAKGVYESKLEWVKKMLEQKKVRLELNKLKSKHTPIPSSAQQAQSQTNEQQAQDLYRQDLYSFYQQEYNANIPDQRDRIMSINV
jgi:hypothetical protein